MDSQTKPHASQFHHFLPRFIVRGWLQEVKTVNLSPGRRSKGDRKRRHNGARRYRQELINTYDIYTGTLNVGTTDLGKTFGIIDMYKDGADATDVYHIEKAFSKLESDAAPVFRILDAAEKRGRSSVELRRSELNTLRKFLFILHYRRSGHAHQFIEGRFDAATAAMVEAYRVKHGLADARAVWLRNLALLLEDEHWEVANDERLLWTTRMDYELCAYTKQLGLYRAPPRCEFVLTENGLGLAEGASSLVDVLMNMSILDAPGAAYHVLTQSFPITPKLVVILRDRLLTHEAGFIRSGMPAEEARKLTHQDLLSTSYFHDLPRTMPTVMHYPPLPPEAFGSNGETTEDDWLEEQRNFEFHGLLPDGQLVASRIRDRLIFDIHNLTEDQAERVNTLLLTHCKETVSFRHPTCLLRSIDAFERDTQLTFYGKKRYASLKTKIIGLSQQATPSVSTSPVHSPSPEASTDSDSPLPTPTSASKLYPGGGALTSPPASKGVTLEESLPGLRGAFIRKPRVVSMVPSDAEVEDPSVTPPGPRSVCSAAQDCTSEKDTEVLHIVSPCVDTGTSVLSSASADSALYPAAASSHHTSNEHATAESSACSPAVEDQAVRRLETALPCLRGAFKRGSDILSPEKFIPMATHRTVPVESAPCSDGLTSVSSTREHRPSRTARTVDEKIDDDSRAVVGSGDDTEHMELEASHCDKSLRPPSTVPTEGPRANREATRELPCGCPIPATVDKGIATHAARVQPRDNSIPTGDCYYAPEPQNHVPARRTLVRRLLTLASKLFCS